LPLRNAQTSHLPRMSVTGNAIAKTEVHGQRLVLAGSVGHFCDRSQRFCDAASGSKEPRLTDAAQVTSVSFAGFGPTSKETPHAR